MGLHSVHDYEARAREVLPKYVWQYYNFAQHRRWCLQESENAFSRYRIRRRVLRDVSNRSLATTVLGQPLKYPICIGPSANHTFAHRDGEEATAKGAEAAEALMVLSCDSCTPMADVAAAAPGGLRWMQIYPFNDRQLTSYIIRQAESLGFKAIVVTVDTPVSPAQQKLVELFHLSRKAEDHSFRNPIYKADIPSSKAAFATGDSRYAMYAKKMRCNPGATWDEIRWFKSITSLPVVCKGIMTAESAQDAADAGADGILVSAHGGRHFDGSPAPIDALAEVVNAVRGRGVEVYMDGGVRTGTDAFMALGRGARALFIGRPALWGLACEGSDGVRNVLQILRNELDDVLAMSGCTSVHNIPADAVVHQSYYHPHRYPEPLKSCTSVRNIPVDAVVDQSYYHPHQYPEPLMKSKL